MKQIKTKSLLILSGCLILVLIGSSFFLKQTIKKAPNWNEVSLKTVFIHWLPEDLKKEGSSEGTNVLLMYESDVDTYRSLYEKSDAVALVSVVDKSQFTNTILAETKVIEVYKGDMEDSVFIYEPASMKDKESISLNSIMLPMRDQEQYLVFLNQLDETHYNITSAVYGRYNVNDDKITTIEFPLNNTTYAYEEMKSFDMIDFQISKDKSESNDIYNKRAAIFAEAKRSLLHH